MSTENPQCFNIKSKQFELIACSYEKKFQLQNQKFDHCGAFSLFVKAVYYLSIKKVIVSQSTEIKSHKYLHCKFGTSLG